MINKLRFRFICISVVALTLAMILVVGAVNVANYISVRAELKNTLRLISENEGKEPVFMFDRNGPVRSRHEKNMLSEANWFTVYASGEGEILNINLKNMRDPDEDGAMALGEKALSTTDGSGTINGYMFVKRHDGAKGTAITFLNCETRLRAVRMLVLFSALACLGGILLAIAIVALESKRAVRPILRNMEKQKQFITDASHELKTPLTVITTNMELMEMETPGNPWVQGTLKQAGIMRRLVEELVYLSRMEEENAPLSMERLQLDALVKEVAEPFQAMADYMGRQMELRTVPVQLEGDRESLQRLISTLCDNAVKYAEGEDPIELNVTAEGKNARITVSNEVGAPLNKQECDALFERFYRADPSRTKNRQGGFGIGLSIAAAIVEKHRGSIKARMDGEKRLEITCLLPQHNGHLNE